MFTEQFGSNLTVFYDESARAIEYIRFQHFPPLVTIYLVITVAERKLSLTRVRNLMELEGGNDKVLLAGYYEGRSHACFQKYAIWYYVIQYSRAAAITSSLSSN